MSEPAAGQLLQELLDQIGLKAEDLTGDEMFPIRLKLSETAREFQVRVFEIQEMIKGIGRAGGKRDI